MLVRNIDNDCDVMQKQAEAKWKDRLKSTRDIERIEF